MWLTMPVFKKRNVTKQQSKKPTTTLQAPKQINTHVNFCFCFFPRHRIGGQTNKQIPISREPATTKTQLTQMPPALSWSCTCWSCGIHRSNSASHGDNASHCMATMPRIVTRCCMATRHQMATTPCILTKNASHGDRQHIAWQQHIATTRHMATMQCMVTIHHCHMATMQCDNALHGDATTANRRASCHWCNAMPQQKWCRHW